MGVLVEGAKKTGASFDRCKSSKRLLNIIYPAATISNPIEAILHIQPDIGQ